MNQDWPPRPITSQERKEANIFLLCFSSGSTICASYMFVMGAYTVGSPSFDDISITVISYMAIVLFLGIGLSTIKIRGVRKILWAIVLMIPAGATTLFLWKRRGVSLQSAGLLLVVYCLTVFMAFYLNYRREKRKRSIFTKRKMQ